MGSGDKAGTGQARRAQGLAETLIGAGTWPLPVTLEHAAAVEDLPPHHRDPFDRMLIAQAALEGAVVVTRDEAFRPYGVPLIW